MHLRGGFGPGLQPTQGQFDHVAVELHVQVEAFGRGNEMAGREALAGLGIAHAQQQFEVAPRLGRAAQRQDGLAVEFEQPAIERFADPHRPVHRSGALLQFAGFVVGDADAVAAQLLGGETRAVGQRQQAGGVGFAGPERRQADADGHVQGLVLPADPEALDRAQHDLGGAQRRIRRAVQQECELIAADPEHLVVLPGP